MTLSEIVVLSSSPSSSVIATTPPQRKLFTSLASSPMFPSPSQMMLKGSVHLVNESHKISAAGILKGFTTAASLLRQSHASKNDTTVFPKEALPLASPVEKSKGTDSFIIPSEEPPMRYATEGVLQPLKHIKENPKSHDSVSNYPKESNNVLDHATSGPVKKSKVGKRHDKAQTKIKKARVTKPTSSRPSVKAYHSNEKPHNGGDLVANAEKVSMENTSVQVGDGNLGLDQAIARRRDWTPVRTSFDIHRPQEILSEGFSTISCTKFKTVLNTCKYVGGDKDLSCGIVPAQTLDSEFVNKRRKLEIINSSACPPPPPIKSMKKQKPRKKKKLQTITAKATEDFVVNNSPDPSLLQYFSPPASNPDKDESTLTTTERPTNVQRKKPAAESAKRTKKVVASRRKQVNQASYVLSPEKAIQSVQNQDLLFGTSSQLAGEESPTFLKELQQAMKISEAASEPCEVGETKGSASGELSNPSVTSNSSLFASSRNLWSVANRNSEGAMLEPEIVDMADTPKGPTRSGVDQGDVSYHEVPGTNNHTPGRVWSTINDFDTPRPVDVSCKSPLSHQQSIPNNVLPVHMPKSVAESALRQRRKSDSLVKKASVSSDAQLPAPVVKKQPDFQSFTTAKLSKALKGYGFKPVKSRDTMIGLLEKCWEGKTMLKQNSLPPNAHTPILGSTEEVREKSSSPLKRRGRPYKVISMTDGTEEGPPVPAKPPMKPRGRPKKVAVSSTAAKLSSDKLLASTPSILPSKLPPLTSLIPCPITSNEIKDRPPPSLTLPSPATPTRALPIPIPNVAPSPKLASSCNFYPLDTDIFTYITDAITSFPPTHDPNNLTFHEKILIYDPIILEDLASWLNTVGLGKVGVDEEVGAIEVRTWCESKGICCLWKENLKKGARARY